MMTDHMDWKWNPKLRNRALTREWFSRGVTLALLAIARAKSGFGVTSLEGILLVSEGVE